METTSLSLLSFIILASFIIYLSLKLYVSSSALKNISKSLNLFKQENILLQEKLVSVEDQFNELNKNFEVRRNNIKIPKVDLHLEPLTSNNSHIKILIVDDEPMNQQILNRYLKNEKFILKNAINGEDAINFIQSSEHFDIVLLDIMMPKIDGYEVCRKIREKFLPSELPIIMLTAKSQVEDIVEGFNAGANDYLTKPYSRQELLARIGIHSKLLKINSAYERFVPREFFKTLGRESVLDVKLGDQIQGEMTVLFCDIRDFTKISENMTPKENFDFLNLYLRKLIPSIRENSGFIDKYIGDAIMAIFPNDPCDGIKAAVEIQKQLDLFNHENNMEVKLGIGVHTGILMLGTIGDERRMDGTVIADAVNIASRLEGITKVYGITAVISQNTISKCKNSNDFEHRFLGKVKVKGKKDFISVYELLNGYSNKKFEGVIKSRSDFEYGLNCYFEQKFIEAASYFKKILDENPEDKPAKIYLERAAKFMVDGTITDWEAVEVRKI